MWYIAMMLAMVRDYGLIERRNVALADQRDLASKSIAALYEAALRPQCWPGALDNLRSLFGGAACVIYLEDTRTGDVPVWFSVGTKTGEDEYVEHIKDINPRARFAMAHKPGTLVWDYRVLPEAGIDRHPFYDWLRRVHDFRYFVGCRMFEEGSSTAFTSIEWSPRHGHATDAEVELFGLIVPHLEQALRLTMANRTRTVRMAALETATNLLDCAVVVLNRHGGIEFANARADAILSRNDSLAIHDGRLCACKAADTRRLNRMIARALAANSGEHMPVTESGLISRTGHHPPYVVSVCPVPLEPLACFANDAAVLVIIRDNAPHAPSVDLIGALYGLTAREAEVAAKLQSGVPLTRVADDLGISVNTARVHLRAIFLKTGTRSQTELARVLANLPAHIPASS